MQSLQIIFARNVYVVSEKLCGDSRRQNDNLLLFEKSLGRPVPAPPNSLYSIIVMLVSDKSKLQPLTGHFPCGRHYAKFSTNVMLL